MNELEAIPIRDTEGAENPFLSPDGQWVGFFANGDLMKVSLAGGAAVEVSGATGFQGAWGSDDMLVLGGPAGGLFRVSADGGSEPQQLTTPQSADRAHFAPHFLPGDRSLLFTEARPGFPGSGQITAYSLDTGERHPLLNGVRPRYVAGHIVFARGDSLWAVAFDVDQLATTGDEFPVFEGVALGWGGTPAFDVANDGTLVYATGAQPGMALENGALVRVDRLGQAADLLAEHLFYRSPRMSPDGRRMAFVTAEAGANEEIWVWEPDTDRRILLATGGRNMYPVWAPDGLSVTFGSLLGSMSHDRLGIFSRRADGSGETEALLTREVGVIPSSWSRDGKSLLFWQRVRDGGPQRDIWVLPVDGQPRVLVEAASIERSPRFSPDGRWFAYVSNDSGREEVYVLPFERSGPRVPISSAGGTEPVWSRDGRELFYRPLDGDGLMIVDVSSDPSFEVSSPRLLFGGRYVLDPAAFANYDVAPDGQTFVMVRSDDSQRHTLNVVLHWPGEWD